MAQEDSRRYDPAMFTGFVRFADGRAESLHSLDRLAGVWANGDTVVWLDFEGPHEDELRALGAVIGLDDSCLEDCLQGEQRPRIDEFADYIFLVLYGMVGIESSEDYNPRKLAIFCGRRFLVTVHREPLRTVGTMRERCQRSASTMLGQGVDSCLFHIIDGMVDRYLSFVEGYENRVEELEEFSLDANVDERVLIDSAALRRELLDLRRLAVSQRELLIPLARGEYGYVSENLERGFHHVCDHLSQVIDLVDALREQLGAVRENYHNALANRTNSVMKTLTIFASILLPLTFVAGIYGMNLPLWPPPEAPQSFWLVVGAMATLATGLLVYFRRKGWL